jgi:uncharacterized coiled-coil protein SlyX
MSHATPETLQRDNYFPAIEEEADQQTQSPLPIMPSPQKSRRWVLLLPLAIIAGIGLYVVLSDSTNIQTDPLEVQRSVDKVLQETHAKIADISNIIANSQIDLKTLSEHQSAHAQRLANLEQSIERLQSIQATPPNSLATEQRVNDLSITVTDITNRIAAINQQLATLNKPADKAPTQPSLRPKSPVKPTPPQLPVNLLAIDVWDNTPIALLNLNGTPVQVRAGQSIAGWTLMEINRDQNSVAFRHDTTALKATLNMR